MSEPFSCAAAFAIVVDPIMFCLIDLIQCFGSKSGQSSEGNEGRSDGGGHQMITVRHLEIYRSVGNITYYVEQVDDQSVTRFMEIAQLLNVTALIISASIDLHRLSAKTKYVAHLIFKTTPDSYGLDNLMEATIYAGRDYWRKDVCLKPTEARPSNRSIGLPIERSDGWMELELAKFYCNNVSGYNWMMVSIRERNENEKSGLMVAGIEIRETLTDQLMLVARDLDIAYSNDIRYWRWVRQKESRFTEVAELLESLWLKIEAEINLLEFLAETSYAAYLIYKSTPNTTGLNTFQMASVSVGGDTWYKNVCLNPVGDRPHNKSNVFPVKRSDGWMELELGQFYCAGGAGKVLIRLYGEPNFSEYNLNKEKVGWLIIAGIEVRPI